MSLNTSNHTQLFDSLTRPTTDPSQKGEIYIASNMLCQTNNHVQPCQPNMDISVSTEDDVLIAPDQPSTEVDRSARIVPDTMGLTRVSVKLVRSEERVRLLTRMR